MSRQTASLCALCACAVLAAGWLSQACGGKYRVTSMPETTDRERFAAHSERGREYLRAGQPVEAEKELLAALEQTRSLRASDVRSQAALGNLENVADLYREQDRHEDYVRLVEILLVETERVRGPDAPSLAALRQGLGDSQAALGNVEASEAAYRSAIEAAESRGGPADPAASEARFGLANLYRETDRSEQAASELREIASALDASGREDDLATAQVLVAEGEALTELGRLDEAEVSLERARRIGESRLGQSDPALVPMLGALGRLYAKQGRDDEAEVLLTRALELQSRVTPSQLPTVGPILDLAEFYAADGRAQATSKMADRATELLQAREIGGPRLARALAAQGDGKALSGKHKQAAELYAEAAAQAEAGLPGSRRLLASILGRQAAELRELGRADAAAEVDARRATLRKPQATGDPGADEPPNRGSSES